MKLEELRGTKQSGISKTKLVLGAAGLLLFIVGVRKTFRPEGAPEAPDAREERRPRR